MDRKIWAREDLENYLKRIVEEFDRLEDLILHLEDENRNLREENENLYEEAKKWEEKARGGGIFSRIFGKKEEPLSGDTDPIDTSSVRAQLEEDFDEPEDPEDALLQALEQRQVEEVPRLFIRYLQEEPSKDEVLEVIESHIPQNDPPMLNVLIGLLGDELLDKFLRKNTDLVPLVRNKAVDFPNQWKVCKHLYLIDDPYGSNERQVQTLLQILTESRDFLNLPTKEGELFTEMVLAVFNVEEEEGLAPFIRILKREELDFLKNYLSAFKHPEGREDVLRELENRSWYLRGDTIDSAVKLKVYKKFMEKIEEL